MDYIWVKLSPLIKSDKLYLKVRYYLCMRRKLNLNPPRTFNEKLQWLKLYDRRSHYSKLVDKYEVKKVVGDLIGEEYIIPTYGIWDSIEAIDFNTLPDQFVLKCTHDSQSFLICEDKSKLTMDAVRKRLGKHMKENMWYLRGREFPYKGIRPRIIAEKFLVDESNKELKDYKFLCFDGKPCYVWVDKDRHTNHTRNVYDMNWQLQPWQQRFYENYAHEIPKPENFSTMVEIAEKLSQGFAHVRVDLYNVDGRIYFGELTFTNGSGMELIHPKEYNLSISATTRSMRPSEQEGREYFFKTKEEFKAMIDNDELLEYAEFADRSYGTPRSYVEELINAGKDVILEIEVQGALQVKEKYPDVKLLASRKERKMLYDRHMSMAEELLSNSEYDAPGFLIDGSIKDFYDFTADSFKLENYRYSEFNHRIPVAV